MEALLLYIPIQSQCFVQYVQILIESGCHSCSMDLNFIVLKIMQTWISYGNTKYSK